jgi:3-phenylpropionate/trans-cinnamate dioxygenase ferredoxin subunit
MAEPSAHDPVPGAEALGAPAGSAAGTATSRIDVGTVDEVPPGTMKLVTTPAGDLVLLVNVDGEIRAFQGVCSHEYFELDKGFLTGGTLTCALHLSRFDLTSGEPLDPPAELPLVRYPVSVEGERIFLVVPPGPLPVNG